MTTDQAIAVDSRLAAAALECAGDAVIAVDLHGTITLWNRMATELFGFTADQAIGQSVEIIVPENLREAHWRGFDAAMKSGHLASDGKARRTKGITAGGGKVYITMTFAVMKDDAGETIGSVAVAREYVKES